MERRRAIVDVALQLFADRGYDGCTMREIAGACGIGATLLYRYFPTKADVLNAVADRAAGLVRELGDALRDAARAGGDVRSFLLRSGAIVLAYMQRLHPWYAIWFSSVRLPAQRHDRVVEAQESVYCAIADGLAARGRYRDPYVTARTFTGTLSNVVMLQERARFEVVTEQLRGVFLEELVEVISAMGDVRRAR